jgi:hypothetical protein
MQRISYCGLANKHVGYILDSPEVKANVAATQKWTEFQRRITEIVRTEADLIFSCLPFYLSSGQTSLTATAAFPLIWPLSAIETSPHVSSTQREYARNALLQIGEIAMIPLATKLANPKHLLNLEVLEEAHMRQIHLETALQCMLSQKECLLSSVTSFGDICRKDGHI